MKRSPHHETAEWLSRFHNVSAVAATVIGLAEGSTARNSFSPQHPKKFPPPRPCRNVCAVVRRKGTTDCGPCLERKSSSPSTRTRSNPNPRCDSSTSARHSFSTPPVKRREEIPVVAPRHPSIDPTTRRPTNSPLPPHPHSTHPAT